MLFRKEKQTHIRVFARDKRLLERFMRRKRLGQAEAFRRIIIKVIRKRK
jgi:hypothetical protein